MKGKTLLLSTFLTSPGIARTHSPSTHSCPFHSIEQQTALFDNIKPLFSNKPLIIVCTKTDVCKLESLNNDKQQNIKNWAKKNGATLMHMSSHAESNVSEVKNTACRLLLEKRLSEKMVNSSPITTVP